MSSRIGLLLAAGDKSPTSSYKYVTNDTFAAMCEFQISLILLSGVDGTRTRGLRRDRPAL